MSRADADIRPQDSAGGFFALFKNKTLTFKKKMYLIMATPDDTRNFPEQGVGTCVPCIGRVES